MSTPAESFEIAVDDSNDEADRERAIGQLETANDCDRLADLVRNDDLDDRYREQALSGLAHPQCITTLEELADDDALSEPLREQAETLFDETPEDSGAGP